MSNVMRGQWGKGVDRSSQSGADSPPDIEYLEIPAFLRRQPEKSSSIGSKMADDISREELDAKLDAVDARVDARLAHFERTAQKTLSDFELEMNKIMEPVRYLRTIVIGSTTLMIAVIGIAFAAFDSGRDTAAESRQAALELRAASEAASKATAELNTARESLQDSAKGRGMNAPPPDPSQK